MSKFRYPVILLLFLMTRCSVPSGENDTEGAGQSADSLAIVSSAFANQPSKAPSKTRIDTCPPPLIVKVPSARGGSYNVVYTTGTAKIDLIPPQVILLPVSKEVSTKTTIGNPEAQGIGFFTTYTTDNGLALDGITDGICDKAGYLWFCTAGGGVSRFDGKSFTSFTTAQGLANSSVWGMTEDKQGDLWFATQVGVSRYDGKTFTRLTTADGLPNNIVRCVTTDRSGNIWFGTNGGGVSRYDGKTFTSYSTAQGLAYDYVYAIAQDSSGNMWFGTVSGGASMFDGRTFRTFTKKDGLAEDVVVSICVEKSGDIWFGTYGGGISHYDGKTFTTYTTSDGLASNTIWRIVSDNSGNIWFGTDGGGITRFDGKTFTNFTTSQGLSNNTVWGIVEDNSGSLWFGTLGGGVCRYNGKSFTNFTTGQGLANNLVRSITEDNSGNIWFGTDLGGTSRYDGRSFTGFSQSQGLGSITVWSIGKDREGNLWFGTAGGGVSKYDGKSFTTFNTEQGLAGNIIRSVYEDTYGNMWFGSWLGGVSKFDGKVFSTYTAEQGLANNSVLDIAEDKDGNYWFSTYGGGVSCLKGNQFVNFSSSEGLVNDNVKCVTIDSAGNLWFGTEGGISVLTRSMAESVLKGRLKKTGMLFKNFTTKEGLPNNVVMKILQSRKGTIYAGTNYGICEISSDSAGNLKTGRIFSSLTGYPVKDVNSGFNTIYEDRNGIVWAATGSDKTAVVRFDPEAVTQNIRPPDVFLQGIKVNNENVSWYFLKTGEGETRDENLAIVNEEYQTFGKELSDQERLTIKNKFGRIRFNKISRFYPVPGNLELPYTNNNVTFEYNALETSRHQMIRYRYILEGYDKDWSPETDKTTAVFGNIYEGTYTFRVKACSPDGVWSEPLEYRFRVLPPWYRTWLLYSIYLILFVTVLYSVYRWRVARLRKENIILEEKVKLRTSELRQANTEIEAQRDLVTRQKEHIEEIHKEVTDSITYAKRLQTSALPNIQQLREHFTDLFILFKPKDLVSGDFYWFGKVKNNLVVTVADCTGHGVPGAFMSMLGISLLKEIVIKEGIIQPDLILNILRDEIIKALGQTGASGEQKDGMDISICSIDMQTLNMQWSGANLPCFIVREGIMTELKGDKMPIAIYEKMDKFTMQEVRLQKSDIIFLSGDGYHDQFGGPNNKKFMSKRFKELLVSISGKPMNEQLMILNDTIQDWETGYETKYQQTDDITVMGIKI